MTENTADQDQALVIAHRLVDLGVPVFAAAPDSLRPGEFHYPSAWQTWKPNHRAVEQWRPGWALAAVTGVVFDVIDVDPRNGGEAGFAELDDAGAVPFIYGKVWTPSDGTHLYIARTHLAKGKPAQGIDLQAGQDSGEGRGFVFLPPTVRVSKYGERLGQEVAYRWDISPLREPWADVARDEGLARLIDLCQATRPAARLKGSPVAPAASSDDWDVAEDWTAESAQRLVDGQLEAVRGAKAGEVNGTLGGAARIMGRFVAGGWLDREDAIGALLAALKDGGVHSDDWNRAHGLSWVAASVISRGISLGEDEPWTVMEAQTAIIEASEAQTEPGPGVTLPGQLPSPREPMRVARVLAPHFPQPLTWWRGDFYQWMGTHWEAVAEPAVIQWLYRVTENATYPGTNTKGEPEAKGWAPNRARVMDVLHALGHGMLQRQGEAEPALALTNGVLAGRELRPHAVDRFNLTSLPFAYDPGAACSEWHKFLDSVLPGDRLSQDFLAEWFGYVLSGRTDMQKMAVLVGPRRCGKGTISRVLEAMVGPQGWAAPTMARLGGNFGLASMVGKSLAVMGDVRWTSKHVVDAVPVLLGIVGEDGFTVDRKNREDWIGQLGTRIMLMSNDAPSFTDASNALSGRMVYAAFDQSFYGREDLGLEARLMAELPGILNWALDGLDRLTAVGHFSQSSASMEVRGDVDRDSSPVAAWVDDRCVLDPTGGFTLDSLISNYKDWLEAEHIQLYPSNARFSRDLRAAFGDKGVAVTRKTGKSGGKFQWVTGLRPLAGASMDYDT